MANDPSMPPSEQADRVPTNNSPAMAPTPAPMPAPAGGNVMITIPKAAFDAVHTLVLQLATGLDQLKKHVDSQSAGAPQGAPSMPAPAPAATPAPAASEDESSENEQGEDEDFLKGVAEAGNKS
jgi:hypothetical protein